MFFLTSYWSFPLGNRNFLLTPTPFLSGDLFGFFPSESMFVGPPTSFLVQKLGDTMVLPIVNRKAAVSGMVMVKKLENVFPVPPSTSDLTSTQES